MRRKNKINGVRNQSKKHSNRVPFQPMKKKNQGKTIKGGGRRQKL